MTTQEEIREALKTIMSEGEANACQIFKGWDAGTGKKGWHFKRFGHNATAIGDNKAEALEWIATYRDERNW